MKRKDRHGLLLLAIVVVAMLAAGWVLMRGSRFAMRQNAYPDAQHDALPGTQPPPTTTQP